MKFSLPVVLFREKFGIPVTADGQVVDGVVTIERVCDKSNKEVSTTEHDIKRIKQAAWEYEDAKNEEFEI